MSLFLLATLLTYVNTLYRTVNWMSCWKKGSRVSFRTVLNSFFHAESYEFSILSLCRWRVIRSSFLAGDCFVLSTITTKKDRTGFLLIKEESLGTGRERIHEKIRKLYSTFDASSMRKEILKRIMINDKKLLVDVNFLITSHTQSKVMTSWGITSKSLDFDQTTLGRWGMNWKWKKCCDWRIPLEMKWKKRIARKSPTHIQSSSTLIPGFLFSHSQKWHVLRLQVSNFTHRENTDCRLCTQSIKEKVFEENENRLWLAWFSRIDDVAIGTFLRYDLARSLSSFPIEKEKDDDGLLCRNNKCGIFFLWCGKKEQRQTLHCTPTAVISFSLPPLFHFFWLTEKSSTCPNSVFVIGETKTTMEQ